MTLFLLALGGCFWPVASAEAPPDARPVDTGIPPEPPDPSAPVPEPLEPLEPVAPLPDPTHPTDPTM